MWVKVKEGIEGINDDGKNEINKKYILHISIPPKLINMFNAIPINIPEIYVL